MPTWRITDPKTGQVWTTEGINPPSDKDLDELFGNSVPPISDPAVNQHPWLAAGARIAGGIGGAAIGEVVGGPAGAMAGGALGSAAGESLGEYIGGEQQSPAQIGVAGALGLAAPAATTIPRMAAFGAGSVTLDAIARQEGVPSPGQIALGALFAVGVGKGADYIMTRTSLREVLPKDVADEAHPILTKGRLKDPPKTQGIREQVSNIRHVQDQMQLPWKPVPVPDVDLSEVSEVGPARYEPRVKGRFTKLTSSAKQIEMEGMPPRPQAPYGPEMPPPTPPSEPEPQPFEVGRVRPGTAITSFLARPGRLFDELQVQTKLPVYDDVYVPLRDNMHNPEKLKEVVKHIRSVWSGNEAVPEVVARAVDRITHLAESGSDGTLRDLSYGIREFTRRFTRGYEMDPETATRWAYHMITTPQVGLLPGRVGPTMRVWSHLLQTGYMTLDNWFFTGLRKGLTREGMRFAREAGALEAGAVDEELEQVAKGTGLYDRMVRLGFLGFKKSNDLNRSVMFHGQYERTLGAARRAGRDLTKFVDYANLDFGIPQSEAAAITRMYADGHVREAAIRSGIARADYSIPTHSRLDRPEAMTGSTLGRVTFGLYNWPSFYGSLIRNTWLPKALGGAGEGSAVKKGAAFARWVAANSFLYGLAKQLYGSNVSGAGNVTKTAQEKARELTFFGPVFYEGGPMIQSAVGGISTAKKLASGEKVSKKQAWKTVEPAIPFSYAAEDLIYYGMKLKKTVEDR